MTSRNVKNKERTQGLTPVGRKGRKGASVMTQDADNRPFAAVCGLYCPACTLYIGSGEEPDRLSGIAERFGVPVEEARCHGCRSDVQSFYCRACEIKKCAEEKGIPFCALCREYPCGMLREFQAARPHRAELFTDGERIRSVGFDAWFQEVRGRYACPECDAINSAYDLACRKCGREPGSPFVEKHGEAVKAALAALVQRTDE